MSKNRVLHPNRNPDFNTGAYSDGIVSGDLLFVSGQASVDFTNSQFMLGTIEEETTRTLDNVKAIVEAAGSTMDDVVKCTVHLSDIADFAKFNQVYTGYFGKVKPARTTVQSVLAEGIKVEIDAIVRISPKRKSSNDG
ncbi:MAG: RutC family protein y4sK [Cyclobacteriaceae bacterium]|nr:MAG: RutC family protein y4sK [Cyclobacteriaceae bacterium]